MLAPANPDCADLVKYSDTRTPVNLVTIIRDEDNDTSVNSAIRGPRRVSSGIDKIKAGYRGQKRKPLNAVIPLRCRIEERRRAVDFALEAMQLDEGCVVINARGVPDATSSVMLMAKRYNPAAFTALHHDWKNEILDQLLALSIPTTDKSLFLDHWVTCANVQARFP